jgi:hypothetical protein
VGVSDAAMLTGISAAFIVLKNVREKKRRSSRRRRKGGGGMKNTDYLYGLKII